MQFERLLEFVFGLRIEPARRSLLLAQWLNAIQGTAPDAIAQGRPFEERPQRRQSAVDR